MQESIYIADDEKNIREVVKSFLESEGYQVQTFENGDLLFSAFLEKPCDLIILDIMMPGRDGFSICKEIRKQSTVPIIMLTARDSDMDYAAGINLGSDDYFTKPFSAISLVMRIKAIFRRIEFEKNAKGTRSLPVLRFEDIEINQQRKIVKIDGYIVELTPIEYNLLTYLVENSEKAVSRNELLNKIWGYNSEVETRAADDSVRRLRKKIQPSRAAIETVWGFGFRLIQKSKEDDLSE